MWNSNNNNGVFDPDVNDGDYEEDFAMIVAAQPMKIGIQLEIDCPDCDRSETIVVPWKAIAALAKNVPVDLKSRMPVKLIPNPQAIYIQTICGNCYARDKRHAERTAVIPRQQLVEWIQAIKRG